MHIFGKLPQISELRQIVTCHNNRKTDPKHLADSLHRKIWYVLRVLNQFCFDQLPFDHFLRQKNKKVEKYHIYLRKFKNSQIYCAR